MLGILEFLFTARGRVSRRDIWLKFLAPYVALIVLASLLDTAVFHVDSADQNGPAEWIVALVYFWPVIAVVTKRFHDLNMTGWWQVAVMAAVLVGVAIMGEVASSGGADQVLAQPLGLFGLLLAVGSVLAEFVALYMMPGRIGPNRFGDDPRAPRPATAAAFS